MKFNTIPNRLVVIPVFAWLAVFATAWSLDPNTKIKLRTTQDNEEFSVSWGLIQQSKTLKKMVNDLGYEKDKEFPVHNVSSRTFALFVAGLKSLVKDLEAKETSLEAKELLAYKNRLLTKITLDKLGEFINTADYFDCKPLLELAAKTFIERFRKEGGNLESFQKLLTTSGFNKDVQNYLTELYSKRRYENEFQPILNDLDRLKDRVNPENMPSGNRITPYGRARDGILLTWYLKDAKEALITAYKRDESEGRKLEEKITQEATGEWVMCLESSQQNQMLQELAKATGGQFSHEMFQNARGLVIEGLIDDADRVLHRAYDIAKEKGDDGLVDFFKNAFLGQGCLNGRNEYIERWIKLTSGDFFNPSKICDVILGDLYAEFLRLNWGGEGALKHFLTNEYKVVGKMCTDRDSHKVRAMTEKDVDDFIKVVQ